MIENIPGNNDLPEGIRIIPLKNHVDKRGALTEVFRSDWFNKATPPIQWNFVRSERNVLRGVHVHHTHEDFLFMAQGRMTLALYDIRRSATTFRQNAMLELNTNSPCIVQIPVGVAHGFYFPETSLLFYAVTHYWDLNDELGCRWDDPGLELAWNVSQPVLSERDELAGSLDEMIKSFETASPGIDG